MRSIGEQADLEGQAEATAVKFKDDRHKMSGRCDASELEEAFANDEAFSMLKDHRVCLESYPEIADAHLDDAVDFLRSDPIVATPCALAPTAKANLLGNFLMASTDAAENLLIQATERMIVFDKCDLLPRPLGENFPDSLSAIFVRRLKTGSNKIRVEKSEKSTGFTVFIGGDLGIECHTSPKYKVTLTTEPGDQKNTELGNQKKTELGNPPKNVGALIPQDATWFCYVFPSDQYEQFIGGFLYLNDDMKPLAVNAVSFTPTLHALAFKAGKALKDGEADAPRIGLTPEAVWYLQGLQKGSDLHGQSQMRPVTVEALKKRGATHYAFVPPEVVRGDTPRFYSGPFGGFAYWLKNGETVYFEIEGGGEVLARSVFFGNASVRCAMLPDSATEKDLKARPRRISPWCSRLPWCSKIRLQSCLTTQSPVVQQAAMFGTATVSSQMTVARLRLTDPLHPVVLRGLALATRREVFATVAARAIAQLAFDCAREAVSLDIVCRLASIACHTVLVYRLREKFSGNTSLGNTLLSIMFALWARDAMKASFLLVSYAAQGWHVDLLSLPTIAEFIYLIVWFGMLHKLAWADADEYPRLMRAAIAFLGTMAWMSLLYLLRGFRCARGLRVLPVFQTLWAVKEFLLIMLFFVFAGAHARFSLAPASIPPLQTVFSVYRLGFLNQFDVPTDVVYATENATEDSEEPDLVPFQYLSFIVVSFVVTIAMTNILIGAISSAFNHYQERASDRLVKDQARLGLDHALLDQGSFPAFIRLFLFGRVCHVAPGDSVPSVLWCCYRDEDSLDQGIDSSSSVRLIKGALRDELMAAQKESAKKVDDSAKKLDRLIEQVAALEKKSPRHRRSAPP